MGVNHSQARKLSAVPSGRPGPKKKEKAKREVPVAAGQAKMPPGLPDAAKAEWNRLAPKLRPLGLLTAVDAGPFALLCLWWSILQGAYKELKTGHYTKSRNGHRQAKPAMTVFRQASSEYVKLADRFGLTPVARQQLEGLVLPPGSRGLSGEEEGDKKAETKAGPRRVTDRHGKPL